MVCVRFVLIAYGKFQFWLSRRSVLYELFPLIINSDASECLPDARLGEHLTDMNDVT